MLNIISHLLLFIHSVLSNSFVTPWTVACLVSLSMGFPRQEYWSGVPFPAPRDLPNLGVKPESPALAGGFFTIQFSSVQSLSHVWLFVNLWTAACQAFLSITNSWSLLKLVSIELVMPFNHLNLCHPLLLPPSSFPSIRVYSNESALCIRWPKYWSFSFSISPSNEYSGLIFFRMDWLDLLAVQGTLKSLLQQHSSKAWFFLALSLLYSPTLTSICEYWKNQSFD